jgi:hypothetical protein
MSRADRCPVVVPSGFPPTRCRRLPGVVEPPPERLTFQRREPLASGSTETTAGDPDGRPLALRFPANPILKEEHVEQASTVKAEGLGSVLQGCASCCDGVLQQVRDAGLDQDIIRRLEQARDLCRSLGEELPG